MHDYVLFLANTGLHPDEAKNLEDRDVATIQDKSTGERLRARYRCTIGGMTASQLQDLLVKTLSRKAGGSQWRWRVVLGPVHVHDVATHEHCNWSVRPSGGTREVTEIEQLLDAVRLDHPLVCED